jgi:Rrf2 family nitric oxide-sensitive transcriptional repressor
MNQQSYDSIRTIPLPTAKAGAGCMSSQPGASHFVCNKRGRHGTLFDVNLRTQTDYAMRVLLYLAFKQEQTPVETISDAFDISKDHLVKVVQQLVRMGYVRSQSGRFGGVRLARRPEEIVVAEVLSDFEGRNGVLPCVGEPTACVLEPGCVLRNLLMKAEAAFYGTFDGITLADLIKGNVAQRAGGVYNLTVRPRTVAFGTPLPAELHAERPVPPASPDAGHAS